MTIAPHAHNIAARKLAEPNFIAQPTLYGPVYICRARDGLVLGKMNADLVEVVLDALNRAPLLQREGPHG